MHKIFVKTLTGNTLTIQVDTHTTIAWIKDRIVELEQAPLDDQRLVFAGKVLSDHRTVQEYSIQRESTLHLIPPST